MHHIFVETNFLIDLLRPFPSDDAKNLYSAFERQELQLYLPWVCVPETKRTLTEIIKKDLGFHYQLRRWALRTYPDRSGAEHQSAQSFAKKTKSQLREALQSLTERVDEIAAAVEVIEPSRDVVDKTMNIYPIKLLPPFDEMVLGAVLAHAKTIREREADASIYFFNLNSKDFRPESSLKLQDEYDQLGMSYQASFKPPLRA